MFRLFLVLFVAVSAASSLSAKTLKYGDWSWGTAPDLSYTFSGTLNEQGHGLSKYCYLEGDGQCYFIVSSSVECDAGESYPALLNTTNIQQTGMMTCAGQFDGRSQFILSPYEAVKQFLHSTEAEVDILFGATATTMHLQKYSAHGAQQAIEGMEHFFGEIYQSKNSANAPAPAETRL